MEKTKTKLKSKVTSSVVEKKVEKIIAKVRPYVQMHGGDVFLTGVSDGVVTLQVVGACKDCSLSAITYNKMLGGIIKDEIPEIKNIIIS
jgi:Fe-S cluster biogenesis protein NfuA